MPHKKYICPMCLKKVVGSISVPLNVSLVHILENPILKTKPMGCLDICYPCFINLNAHKTLKSQLPKEK